MSTRQSAPARGGLAGWQQRILVDYIEENLAERISLGDGETKTQSLSTKAVR